MTALEDMKVHTKIKIAALWASTMFCYIYGDYFELYMPDKLAGMLAGNMVPLGPVTQGVLLGTSAMMAVPSLMVFLSLVLKPQINRWVNIVLGIFYTLIMLAVIPGTWSFYMFFGCMEVVLTASIVWYAWSWPRQAAA